MEESEPARNAQEGADEVEGGDENVDVSVLPKSNSDMDEGDDEERDIVPRASTPEGSDDEDGVGSGTQEKIRRTTAGISMMYLYTTS